MLNTNEIIAKYFEGDPSNAVRAHAAVQEILRAQSDARPVADDARIRAIKDAVWAECEGFELMDEEARRILSALDSLTRASAAPIPQTGGYVTHDQAFASAATVAEPSAANLEGLAKALLAPREIVRDADGWLDHPALPVCDEGVRFDALLGAFGLETYFRAMDGDISPEEYDRYYDEQGGCAVWTPTPPEGNGWKLIAIYDTEDGPYAMFAREKQPEPRKRRAKTAQQQAELSDPLDAERQQVNALFKRVEGESIEQHLQRFAEGMDAIQAAQQQAAPGADERVEFEAWPKVLGVGRDNEHPQNLVVYLGAVPTDGELRAIHDNLRAAQSGQRAGVAEGWTSNHDANAALLMLDRLDVQSDDDARVDAIAAIIRRLAAAPTQQQERSE